MDPEIVKIVVAFIAAVVAIVGWNITHFFAKKREDRTRRIELVLAHIENQIEEFYGPLLSRIEQIHSIWDVKERIIQKTESSDTEKVLALIQEEHFFPLHQQIKEIISSKLYLIEGAEMPESFRNFLEHSTQQVIKRQIESDFSLDIKGVEYVPWPIKFPNDVRKSMEQLMVRYNRHLSDLDSVSESLLKKETTHEKTY